MKMPQPGLLLSGNATAGPLPSGNVSARLAAFRSIPQPSFLLSGSVKAQLTCTGNATLSFLLSGNVFLWPGDVSSQSLTGSETMLRNATVQLTGLR